MAVWVTFRSELIEDEAGGRDAPAEGSAEDPTSSSGSDTFVPAESDSDGGSSVGKEDRGHLQLSRRYVAALEGSVCCLPSKVRCEMQDWTLRGIGAGPWAPGQPGGTAAVCMAASLTCQRFRLSGKDEPSVKRRQTSPPFLRARGPACLGRHQKQTRYALKQPELCRSPPRYLLKMLMWLLLQQGPSRRQQPKGGRSNLHAGSRKGSRLVAAARQRVRRAALRNAAK